MKLPYSFSAFKGFLSPKALSNHYLKHHQTYVNNLNELCKNKRNMSLTEIMMTASVGTPLFNNASQVFNHNFYWMSLTPYEQDIPERLHKKIRNSFGSIHEFRREFEEKGLKHFGSGYIWLVQHPHTKNLFIITTQDAMCPILYGFIPILTLDLWEHAYYVDYLSERNVYIHGWWKHVNWQFANGNLKI